MKILQINKFFYPKGGAEAYFFNLCQLLKEKGQEVIHFSMQDEKNLESPQSPYFVSHLDISKPQNSISSLKQVPRLIWSKEASQNLERLIIQEKPEIAHLHNIDRHLTPSIIPILKKYKIPVVMTLHDYKIICPNSTLFANGAICERCKKGKFYNTIYQKCIKNSLNASIIGAMEAYYHQNKKIWNNLDLFLAPSQFMKQKMIDFGYNSDKIAYLPLFLTELSSKQSNLEISDYFLYFGRLEVEKGLDLLIEVFSQLPEEKLKIAGSGTLEAVLKEKVTDLNVKNIEFLGFQEKNNMKKLIEEAKAIIVPSIWYENAPFSVLEAMQMGKIIIASEIGGIPELIQNNETGLTFKPQDEKDLINKVEWVNKNYNKAVRMGEKAKEVIKENYSKERHYQDLIKIYEKT